MKKLRILTSIALALGLLAVPTPIHADGDIADVASLNAAAESGGTFTLTADITLAEGEGNIEFSKDTTIDLNNHSIIDGSGNWGTMGSLDTAKVTFKNGTIDVAVGGMYAENSSTLTLQDITCKASGDGLNVFTYDESTTNIIGGTYTNGGYCVFPADNATINVDGATIVSQDASAIGTNGSASPGAVVNVKNSTLESENDVAVFIPVGTYTITDTDIKGKTAIFMKGGSLKLDGGTVTATGDPSEYDHLGDGCKPTGDAIVVDNEGGGYETIPTLSVSEEKPVKITSEQGSAVSTIYNEANTNADGSATAPAKNCINAGTEIEEKVPSAEETYASGVELKDGVAVTHEVPTIKDGNNNQVWTKGSGKNLTISSTSEFVDFNCVKVDGEVLEKDNYTASSGSTVIELKAEYLETLTKGEHTLEIYEKDEQYFASAKFTVKEAAKEVKLWLCNRELEEGSKETMDFVADMTPDAFREIRLSKNADGTDFVVIPEGSFKKFENPVGVRVQLTEEYISTLKLGKWYVFMSGEENGVELVAKNPLNTTFINIVEKTAKPTTAPTNGGGQGTWDDGSPFTRNANGDVLDRWGNVIWKAPAGFRLVNTGVAE